MFVSASSRRSFQSCPQLTGDTLDGVDETLAGCVIYAESSSTDVAVLVDVFAAADDDDDDEEEELSPGEGSEEERSRLTAGCLTQLAFSSIDSDSVALITASSSAVDDVDMTSQCTSAGASITSTVN